VSGWHSCELAWRQVPEDHREQNSRMIKTTVTGNIFLVSGDQPQVIEVDLNAAVDLARQLAMKQGRHGILITRHTPASFTVAVSPEVPYGVTRESCQIQAAGRDRGSRSETDDYKPFAAASA
jgi:hypothetical protein